MTRSASSCPTGQVDVGVVNRPRPDGAVQWFSEPCEPCHMDGGTGTELLFEAEIEPDFDEDGLGDETQDPDAGFGFDEFDDEWLDDWDDELDEDEEAAPAAAAAASSCSAWRSRPTATRCSSSAPRAPGG